MSVVSKTAETNAVSTYFFSRLAGPRLGKQRVAKGEEVWLSEHQARALLLSGELVTDKAQVDDPFGEAAAAKADKAAADKASYDAKAAAEKAAADAKAAEEADAAAKEAAADTAAADKAAADAAAGHQDGVAHDDHAAG